MDGTCTWPCDGGACERTTGPCCWRPNERSHLDRKQDHECPHRPSKMAFSTVGGVRERYAETQGPARRLRSIYCMHTPPGNRYSRECNPAPPRCPDSRGMSIAPGTKRRVQGMGAGGLVGWWAGTHDRSVAVKRPRPSHCEMFACSCSRGWHRTGKGARGGRAGAAVTLQRSSAHRWEPRERDGFRCWSRMPMALRGWVGLGLGDGPALTYCYEAARLPGPSSC
jgi:hypothetical protein